MLPGIRRVPSISSGMGSRDTIASLLASLMEVVRTTVACECVYVRAMVIKALIWMQSPHDSFDELESIIASELSDPSWPATLLNDILLTLHARFKVCRTYGKYNLSFQILRFSPCWSYELYPVVSTCILTLAGICMLNNILHLLVSYYCLYIDLRRNEKKN